MVPDKEFNDAKESFATMNEKHPNNQDIEKAIKYISKIDYFDKLASEEERNKAFRNDFLQEYGVILTDVEDVKKYLLKVMNGTSPYDWFASPTVSKKICSMAEAEYLDVGCKKALNKIESMSEENVKHYLKRLIKDNMTVGIEIIKDN